nr:unnamed protein product [Naegleria fowleri]
MTSDTKIKKVHHNHHQFTLRMRILRERILSSIKQAHCRLSSKSSDHSSDDGNSLISSLFWNNNKSNNKSDTATTTTNQSLISENTRKLLLSETITKDDTDFKNNFGTLFKQYAHDQGRHERISYGVRRKIVNRKTLRDLPMLVTCLDMEWNSFPTVMNATTMIRRLLSTERDPPIDEVIQSGAMAYFAQFLDFNEIQKHFNVNFLSQVPKLFSQTYKHVQGKRTITDRQLYDLMLEAAWAMTNVASSTSVHTRYAVEMGAISKFIQLIPIEDDEVRSQVIWGLGNIAGDSCAMRDLVLELGAIPLLHEEIVRPLNRLSIKRNGTPIVSFEYVKQCLPTIDKLLDESDEEVLTDACWAAFYASDGPIERLQACVDQDFIPKIIKHVKSSLAAIQTPALRTLGNIITGDDQLTQAVLSENSGEFVKFLPTLLDHPKQSLRKETMWVISNIAAGNVSQIQQLIDGGIVTKVIEKLKGDDFSVQKDGFWALSNICDCGSVEQIAYVVKSGGIEQLIKALHSSEMRVIVVGLEGLKAILQHYFEKDQSIRDILLQIEQHGGIDILERLESHQSNDIFRLAREILDYFDN